MVFKEIIKGKTAYFCDVCNKEINITEKTAFVTFETFFREFSFHLCAKHGLMIKNYMKKLKMEKEVK